MGTRYIQDAAIAAAEECELHFCEYDPKYANMNSTNFAPSVRVIDKRNNEESAFTHIPQHLHHMVFELLKNSMRAVLENDSKKEITVVVVDNSSDGSISVKISDNGGGIPRVDTPKIWRYGYTTGHNCMV